MTFALVISGIVLCILLSAFFSGSEMAFSAANTVRLENLEEDGDKKAGRALYIIHRFDHAISAILIGNNLANVAASSLSTVLIILFFGSDRLSWVGTLVITLLVIVFGETIPKISAKRNATKLAMRYSMPVRVLMVVFWPFIKVFVGLSRLIVLPFGGEQPQEDSEETVEELQSIIDTAEDEGILDKDDTRLLRSAIDFSEIPASEAMTARVDVEAVDIEDSWRDILEFAQKTTYSRIPVYRGSIDNIVGVLHINRFLQELMEHNGGEFDLETILMPPCYVYKTMKLPSVLNQLKGAKQHLAIVTDEFSGTLGVISMEDVLEQIVGDIWDETDTVETSVKQLGNGVYEIDGDLPLSNFIELFEKTDEDFDAQSETVGGWTLEQFDRFPHEGEHFDFSFPDDDGGIRVTVLEMDGRRVAKIRAELK